MGLNIKNAEVERLAAEVSEITGESKTEAIRQALIERKQRLSPEDRQAKMKEGMKWVREEVWPYLTEDQRKPKTKAEIEEILGYGPDGV